MPARKTKSAPGARLHQQSLFDYATPKPSSSKQAQISLQKPTFSSDASPPRASRPAKRKQAQPVQSDSDNSNVEAIHFEPRSVDFISISDTEEDDLASSPRRPAQRQAALASASSRRIVTSDDEVDDCKERANRTMKNGKGKASVVTSSGDESVKEVPAKKRRLVRGKRPPTPDSEEEVDESRACYIGIELHTLSAVSVGILNSRLRTRGKRTQFQKNLEKLKRKLLDISCLFCPRADWAAPGKKKGVAMSSSSEDGAMEGYDHDDARPFDGAKRDQSGSDDNSEVGSQVGEDSFIVADDVTAAVNLPAAFSMDAHQDLSHHFKVICQLFVHMAVRPVQERRAFMEHVLKGVRYIFLLLFAPLTLLSEEDYFSLPLKMARNKLSGLRDSVASSMWRPKLRSSFLSFPIYQLHVLDYAIPHCDACHLGRRTSTLMGCLDGPLYDKYAFEARCFSLSHPQSLMCPTSLAYR
jgi:hypothetical protein